MNKWSFLVLPVTVGLLAAQACAQSPADTGDPARGRALALKICTACHVVAPDQPDMPILQPPAPSFRGIANRKTTTAESLRNFITTTHRTLKSQRGMPNPELTDEQTVSIVAYLMTLKKP